MLGLAMMMTAWKTTVLFVEGTNPMLAMGMSLGMMRACLLAFRNRDFVETSEKIRKKNRVRVRT